MKKFPKLFYRLSIWLVFFISTDLLSTYLVTPDLKYEFNVWVRWFHLGWPGTILLASLQGALFVLGFFLSVRFIKGKLPKWGTIWGAKLGIGLFIFHFAGSVLATINNLIGYFYLKGHQTDIKSFVAWYVVNVNSSKYYLTWFGITKLVVAIWFTPLVFRRLANDKLVSSSIHE
ncbi:MAG: hypothetical protein ACK47E_11280 [Cyclobacteriaceae bacterium]